MRVIPPVTINDTNLLSSTVSEPTIGVDPDIWYVDAPYTVGDKVSILSTHRVYECISNITGGDSPDISVTRAVPKWLEIGSTNKWAMFDMYRSTPSVATANVVTVVLLSQDSDSLAILATLNVSSVHIKATSTADDIIRYDKAYNLTNRNSYTWSEYFFTEITPHADLVLFDLPGSTYGELLIEVVINGPQGMSIGSCILGKSVDMGILQRGGVSDSLNFSSIERDLFGNAYIVQRRSIPKTSQRIFIDKSKLNTLLQLRSTLAAVPALWVGIEDVTDPYFSAHLVLGYYTRLSFQIDNPIGPMILLELEEL